MCVALTAVANSTPWPLAGLTEVGRTMTLVTFVYSLATAAAPVLIAQLLQTHRDLARRLVEIEEAGVGSVDEGVHQRFGDLRTHDAQDEGARRQRQAEELQEIAPARDGVTARYVNR